MAVRVKLDGIELVNTPIGWDQAEHKMKRDKVIKGLFVNYTTDLDFWGDGFNYIDSVMEEGYCSTIDVLIESNDCSPDVWEEDYSGVIQITQLTTYDLNKGIIKTKIFDSSYNAKIDNNKSLKAFVNVPTSKNGETIDAASSTAVNFFDPNAAYNVYLSTARVGYSFFECFRFIIDYMSDGTVDFKSDIFSGEYSNWMLFNGKEVRTGEGGGFNLEVSFKDLFREADKKTNLSFAIEPSELGGANDFQLRLEPTAYFEKDEAIVTLDNVKDIFLSFNKDQLYSNVDIGSSSFEDDVFSTSYPPLNFKAFKAENYTILGDCNIDKTLNLLSQYIIDTNILEDVVVNNEDKYDKKTFIVVTDGVNAIKYKEYDEPVASGTIVSYVPFKISSASGTFSAASLGDMVVNTTTGEITYISSTPVSPYFIIDLQDDIFLIAGEDFQVRDKPYNYNHPLTNVEVITRFLGGIPNSVVKYIGDGGTANFLAERTYNINITAFPYIQNFIPFNDKTTFPNFDDGGNFTNPRYTIPASGLYGFRVKSKIQLHNFAQDVALNGRFKLGGGLQDWNQNSAGYVGVSVYENTLDNYWANPHVNSGSYLKQFINLKPNTKYTIKFQSRWFDPYNSNILGAVGRFPYQVSINGSQLVSINSQDWADYEINLDYSSNGSPTQEVKFSFHGQGKQVNIKNVRVVEQSTYTIQQDINRVSPSGVTQQIFPETVIVSFENNQSQITTDILTEATFSTFLNEDISAKRVVSVVAGSSGSLGLDIQGATFETILTDDGGGDILPQDPTNAPIYKYKFEKFMSKSQFEQLRDNPDQAVLFSNTESNHIFGWRNSIQWQSKTGLAKFELRSKTKIKRNC